MRIEERIEHLEVCDNTVQQVVLQKGADVVSSASLQEQQRSFFYQPTESVQMASLAEQEGGPSPSLHSRGIFCNTTAVDAKKQEVPMERT